MSRLTKGYFIAIAGIIFWSSTGVFIGYLITNYKMPALLLALWRNLLVCIALAPALFLIHRPLLRIQASQIGFYVFYGLILALFNSIWVLSVGANGAAVATVLAYSSAGFTTILAWWLFQEKLELPKIVAVILSLSGCVLVSNAYRADVWKLNPLGVTTGLLSGLLFAAYSLIGKEVARRNINPWTSMLYSFAFGSLFLILFNLFPFLPGAVGSYKALVPDLPAQSWLTLIILSFVPTLLGFGLYNTSMNYLPASIANLLATTEPAMTAVEAYIFLGERMTIIQIVGGLIILSAVLIVQAKRENEESLNKESSSPGLS
jgi:drug/metabolite transporter (DMT)-like permease